MGFQSPYLRAAGEVTVAVEHLTRAVADLDHLYEDDLDALPPTRRRLRERIVTARTQLADLARELHAHGSDLLKGS